MAGIETSSGQDQQTIITALGSFDTPEVRQQLLSLTKSDKPSTRMAATRAVASRRPGAAIGPLCDLLEDELTREAAAQLAIEFVSKRPRSH